MSCSRSLRLFCAVLGVFTIHTILLNNRRNFLCCILGNLNLFKSLAYLVFRFESSEVHPAIISSSCSTVEQLVHREQVVRTRVRAKEREEERVGVGLRPYRVSRRVSSGNGSSTGGTAVLDFRLLRLLSPNNSLKFPQLSKSRAALRSAADAPSSQAISGFLQKHHSTFSPYFWCVANERLWLRSRSKIFYFLSDFQRSEIYRNAYWKFSEKTFVSNFHSAPGRCSY